MSISVRSAVVSDSEILSDTIRGIVEVSDQTITTTASEVMLLIRTTSLVEARQKEASNLNKNQSVNQSWHLNLLLSVSLFNIYS